MWRVMARVQPGLRSFPQVSDVGREGEPLVNPHPEVLVGAGSGQPNSLDVDLPRRVRCLHNHGAGLLGRNLEPQLLSLLADEVKRLLRPPELAAPPSDHENEVISVVQQDGVLVEEQGHKLFHQEVEEEGLRIPPWGVPFSSSWKLDLMP